MKKRTAFLLAVLHRYCMFGFSTSTAKAASASFSVSVDRSSAQVGETITDVLHFIQMFRQRKIFHWDMMLLCYLLMVRLPVCLKTVRKVHPSRLALL